MNTLDSDIKFNVLPCASQQGKECFPCLGIDYVVGDGISRKTFMHVRDRGVYNTLDAAWEAAKAIKVRAVDANGVVNLEPA